MGKDKVDWKAVDAVYVATTHDLPGRQIEQHLGLSAGIGTGSGRTAQGKAMDAYGDALQQLKRSAWEKGANAVVAVSATTFGASTGGALGDAVGVILTGTAVRSR